MDRAPNRELGLAILRVVLGVVYVTHGLPKLMGGHAATAGFLGQLGLPIPVLFAWIVTLLETFGGLALIAGYLVRPVALLFMVEMLVGIILVHAKVGWYVIGPGTGGAEFNTVLIAALLALVLAGPGLASVDGRRPPEPVTIGGERASVEEGV
ncbi:MAG: DoxX family protein [Candidatus Palauibacterales bacterium]|nr:DoxX family protein [Candidatus Palauibacterales bacterium]MDP2528552.1 DoxX family protein [Candidatus Palauibacterales bacterium]